MRKIEKQMIKAVSEMRGFRCDNTEVSPPNRLGWHSVYLHGNLIAAIRVSGGNWETQVGRKTFRQWPTRTTASRLRALGIPASVRKGVAYIGNDPA